MDYLSWPDYLILVAFLVISLGIGVYHAFTGGRQKTTAEFIMANRSLKVLPTALSLLVSFQSAIIVLGMTAEMYSYGSQFLLMAIVGYSVAIVLAVQVAVPWLYPLKLVSVNEYFERRFKSKSVRILASVTSIIAGLVYMGTALYAPSAALESATGLPIVVSVPVMAVVAVAYTALGGMRAVIWTDVFQSVIMFGGLLAVLIKALVIVGGFSNVFKLCSQTGRLEWVNWSPDPTVRHTFWGFLFGYSCTCLTAFGFQQAAVQRYSATKSQSQAKLAVALNVPGTCVFNLIFCFAGLTVVSYYAAIGCDPLTNGDIRNANQLLPHFVVKMFSDAPGFAGLFLAALYGASLSSISSSLSGAAANCWEDILQWKLNHWTESRKALFNRILVVLFGLVATGLAFAASVATGPITQVVIAIVSAVNGPFIGLFLLGGFNRHANWKGALVGGITSLIGSFWLVIGSYTLKSRHPPLPSLSIDGCMNNLTFSNYNDTNSRSLIQFFEESSINETMTYFRPQTNETIEVEYHGLEKFYSISYVWFSFLWMSVTIIVGSLASFLLRDKSTEEKVDETLLISFKQIFCCRNNRRNSDSPPDKYSDVNYKAVEILAGEKKCKKERQVDESL